ncbi:NAD(P)-dependent oxidoreductase [Thiothrix nivea]|uniref:6-phosphogluconate dehydrogenase NAD-binding n=1 Tax=Thiothrix nivea (strain ATCC 35100 / DSM 5205 / JP2) TaxID=870187 RepID=A0A656H9F5_THINJ|nr:NAD(P)-dependent oxidoreductase [Thiothrix nivea]EIJ32757.1 6-phosphogluconate dehydrogenase NAD-binding [Thiothrix nivea DSM 5205]
MQTTKPTIGWIGPGIMGNPMCKNLLQAGFPLAVYARRPESAQELTDLGAAFYASPAELAANADIVISMVSDTPDVEAVLLGENGVIEGAKPGLLVIDMSTISPVTTREIAAKLAEKGICFLDAPVSGGDVGAIAGTLTIMVGGSADDLEYARPALETMGKTITHIGGHGAGQLTKACNQLIAAQTIVAVTEALEMAKAAGVDPAKVRAALLGGFAYSRVLELHGQRILDENYQPGFMAKLHNKDMHIVTDTIASFGLNMPGTHRAADYMQALVDQGDGDLDSSALAKIVQQRIKA